MYAEKSDAFILNSYCNNIVVLYVFVEGLVIIILRWFERLQVDSSLVSFKLRNRELQEDDTYESLRMGGQDQHLFSRCRILLS